MLRLSVQLHDDGQAESESGKCVCVWGGAVAGTVCLCSFCTESQFSGVH
jgi:hypothetical protein